MDTNKKRKKAGKRADKVKPLVNPTTAEAIPKKREPVYFAIEEDNKEKKCYLKKKSNRNFDTQEDVKTASIPTPTPSPPPMSDIMDEDSGGLMQAVINLHSCTSFKSVDMLCANSDEEIVGHIPYDCRENKKNHNSLYSRASNKMMCDPHELDLLKRDLAKERADRAALEEMLEKERSDRAALQDALEKEMSSSNQLKMDLKREKTARKALEEALDNEKRSTATLEKALALEISAAAALEKALHKKKADNASLHKSLQKRKVVISDLQATLTEEQSNCAKVQLKVETLASELESCEKVKKQLKRNLKHSERQLKEQEEANDKLARKNNKEIQELQDHIIELQGRHLSKNASEILVQKLQQEIRTKDCQLLLLKAKADQMSADLIEEKHKRLSVQVDVAAAQSQQQKAEEESIRLTRESKARLTEIQGAKSSLAAQRVAVTQLRERLENEAMHTSALLTQVQTLGETIRAKDELLVLKDQRISQLRSELFEEKIRID